LFKHDNDNLRIGIVELDGRRLSECGTFFLLRVGFAQVPFSTLLTVLNIADSFVLPPI